MVAERKCIDPNYFIEEPLDKKLPLPSGKLDNPLYKLQYKTSNIVAVIPIPKQCFFRMHSHAGKGRGTVHDQSKLIPNQCLLYAQPCCQGCDAHSWPKKHVPNQCFSMQSHAVQRYRSWPKQLKYGTGILKKKKEGKRKTNPASQHFKEKNTDTPPVGGLIMAPSLNNFWSHILHCAAHWICSAILFKLLC